MDEYQNALNVEPNGDRFYLISEAYNLGDEIYYVRFLYRPFILQLCTFAQK